MFFFAVSLYVVLAVAGLIAVHVALPQLRTMAAAVRQDFGRSFLLGLLAQVLFVPGLVVLAVAILTIPVIPVYVLLVAMGLLVGYLAVAFAVGEVAAEQDTEWGVKLRDGSPMQRLLAGLAGLLVLYVLAAPFEVMGWVGAPFEISLLAGAWMVTWVALTAGFGAVVLTRAGTRPAPGPVAGRGPGSAAGTPAA